MTAYASGRIAKYLGVDKRLNNLEHHNLFFDTSFEQHAVEIYDDPQWPSNPLFYVCRPSATDPTVPPEGKENVFIPIPLAPGLDANNKAQIEEDIAKDFTEGYTGIKMLPKDTRFGV